MSPKSFFSKDIQQEQILSMFLDGLYAKLNIQFERIMDKDRQNQGIDIIVTKGSDKYLVDEKAQLDYVGVSMPTFAFEIGCFKEKAHLPGWLFDEKKLTTHYMLITDIYLKEGTSFSSFENIRGVKLLWLNRSKLITFLDQAGLNRVECESAERKARANGLNGKISIGRQGLHFYLSNQKAEAPFNLIVGRSHLLKIGTEICPLTP